MFVVEGYLHFITAAGVLIALAVIGTTVCHLLRTLNNTIGAQNELLRAMIDAMDDDKEALGRHDF